MARPRSDEKRSAILAATVRIIVQQGLSAPTALIAKEAGVANGSLFTYFESKAALFNALYIALKSEMAATATEGVSLDADTRAELQRMWTNWVGWAVRNPDKRKVLALLGASDDLTPATRIAGHRVMADIATLMERSCRRGGMRDVPMEIVGTLMNAIAEATMDLVMQKAENADEIRLIGFNALWRMLE